jgi:uncharacterized protein
LGKLILLVLIGLFVYWILKSYARNAQRAADQPSPTSTVEDMVRCAHCSVNLPKSESILSQGNFFCSDEHRQIFQKERR